MSRVVELAPLPGNNTPRVVQALLEAEDGSVVRLEKGVWNFYRDGACERYFAPSNNANGVKRIVFPLMGKKRLTLDGGGSLLMFHDRLFPFVVSGCEQVTLQNFSVDFSFPRYAVAETAGSDPDGFELRVSEARYPWRTERGCWSFSAGSEERSTADKKFFLARGMKNHSCCYLVAGDTADPLVNLAAPLLRTDARQTGPDLVRFDYRVGSGRIDLDAGQRMIVSYDENRENDVIFIENSAGVTVRGVQIFRGAGMGVIAQLSRDILLEDISVCRRPEREDEIQTVTADVFHFVLCDGFLTLRDCRASDSLDDAVNIHGVYTQAADAEGNVVRAALGHQEQYGLNPYRAGDRILVTRGDGTADRGWLTLTESEPDPDGRTLFLRFEEPVCGVVSPGDYLSCPDRSPDVLIERVRFENCPRVLLGSSRKTVVRDSWFRLRGALTVMDGMRYWHESGPARDVLIERCVFDRSGPAGQAPIAVEMQGGPEVRRAHRGIRILNNTVIGSEMFLTARHADGLTVDGNRIVGGTSLVQLSCCRHVSIGENAMECMED